MPPLPHQDNRRTKVIHDLNNIVVRCFGGQYAKKVPVTAKELGDVYMERAKEMEIEVR